MKSVIVVFSLCLFGSAAWAGDAPPFGVIRPPVCNDPLPGSTCNKLVVTGKTESSQLFAVLTIGPGGRICGPATVRLDKDLEVLTLSKGVCIPAEEK